MDKITRWMFAFLAAALLAYACFQFATVQQNLQNARTSLVELKKTAERLTAENDVLSRSVGELSERDLTEPTEIVTSGNHKEIG